jgi:unsaturated rhamnogalacturonyl hydrolase
MAQPFEALYQETFGNGDVSDILKQVRTVQEKMRDPGTGLYYHGYDASRKAFWANPETGLSRCVWLRALGWFFMALADLSEILPDGAERDEIAGIFRSLAESVARYADPETGLYWQVVDQGSREGNYLESSGSSMVAYAMMKGARLGILDVEFAEKGKKTFDGIIRTCLKAEGENIGLTNICLVSGLGDSNGKPRDGSYEYYISEPVVCNDAKGVAPFVLCYSEIRQMLSGEVS